MNLALFDKSLIACAFPLAIFLVGAAFAQTETTKKPASAPTGIMSFEDT
jgi:hypothetical protein